LRISPRTIRHYESLGLLRPHHRDGTNGYRDYSGAELLRGVQIEQLKAAGLSLTDIGLALDDEVPLRAILDRKRHELHDTIRESTRQLQVIGALADATWALATAELTVVSPVEVVTVRASSTPEAVAATVRREIQRLRRQLKRCEPNGAWTFAARFPLDLDDEGGIDIDVAAHVARPTAGSTTWPSTNVLQTTLVGPVPLLPLAYDAVLEAAAERHLTPLGTVQETYRDLGPVGTTIVALPVQQPH
jgi:DNA-binding transcriptional MerR regulator